MSPPESSTVTKAGTLGLGLLAALSTACRNVSTDPFEQNAESQRSVTPAESDVLLAPFDTGSPPPALATANGNEAEDATNTEAPTSFSLQLGTSELAGLGCRVWLDFPESDLLVTDVEVRLLREEDPTGLVLAKTLAADCSPANPTKSSSLETDFIPVAVTPGAPRPDASTERPGDAGIRHDSGSDGAGKLGDATAPPADAAAVDAAPLDPAKAPHLDATTPDAAVAEPHLVDLREEGWNLELDVDGLWLEFCPNACHTLLDSETGRLSMTVWYAVKRSAGAR